MKKCKKNNKSFWWDISIDEVSWMFLKWFRSYGPDTNLNRGQIQSEKMKKKSFWWDISIDEVSWMFLKWFRSFDPDTNQGQIQSEKACKTQYIILISPSIKFQECFLKLFRGYGPDINFDQGQIQSDKVLKKQYIIWIRCLHQWSFMNVSQMAQKLWPRHKF